VSTHRPRGATLHFAAGFRGLFRVISGSGTRARNDPEILVPQRFPSLIRRLVLRRQVSSNLPSSARATA
jgi:hypothetical protein